MMAPVTDAVSIGFCDDKAPLTDAASMRPSVREKAPFTDAVSIEYWNREVLFRLKHFLRALAPRSGMSVRYDEQDGNVAEAALRRALDSMSSEQRNGGVSLLHTLPAGPVLARELERLR